MGIKSTPGQLPEGIDREAWELGTRLHDLTEAILRLVSEADPAIPQDWRTACLADAVSVREMHASGWCAACEQHLPGDPPLCRDHDRGDEHAISLRRYLYNRMGAHLLQDLPA